MKKISRRKLLAITGITGWGVSTSANASAKDLLQPVWNAAPEAVFNVKDYGALGDGVHDDTRAVQEAINKAAEGGGGLVVFPPAKSAYLMGGLVINRPVSIMGIGAAAQIKALANTRNLFTIASGMVKIENLNIDMENTNTDAVTFYLDSKTQSLHHIYLDNLVVSNAFTVLQDANGEGIIVHLHVTNMACRVNRGVSVFLRDSFAYIYFTNLNIDNVPTAMSKKPVDFPGIIVENAQGLHFEKCDVTGGNGYETGDGFLLRNCEAVHFNTCMADYVGGVGFRFINVFYLYLSAVVASLCSRGGIALKDCYYVNGTNVTTAGRSKMPDKPEDKHGICAVNCEHMVFSVISTRFNTGNGLVLENCRHTSWQTVDLYDNDGNGVTELGASPVRSTANIISACTFSKNKKGNYRLQTAGAHIGHAVLQNGKFQATQSGPC